MKLLLTTVATDTFTVSRHGKTVGEMVNDVIQSNLADGLQVTNISLELTQEDMIALRMLTTAPNDETTVKEERKPDKKASYYASHTHTTAR